MARSTFEIDRLRLEAAHELPPSCFDDFQRLSRTLVHGPAFQWLLVDAPSESLQRQVRATLDRVLRSAGLRVSQFPLSARIEDAATLEARLVAHAQANDVVHVLGGHGWFDASRWDAFNARRERIAAHVRARVVFWLDAPAIEAAAIHAPDLWAWRGGVYAFAAQPGSVAMPAGREPVTAQYRRGPDARSMTERHRRIAQIQAWLEATPDAPPELVGPALDELGMLLEAVGDYDAAMRHWREVELPFHQARGSELSVANTLGQIADVVASRGDYREAMRIWREDVLPVLQRHGNERDVANALFYIAGLLHQLDEPDEALSMLREQVLPMYEQLRDERGAALTQGSIADILAGRGDLAEALRIRREEELPVYERLGDARSVASTHDGIARLLAERGELDEALRIERERVMPAYEALGDVHMRAITQQFVSYILELRSQFDEALRILREDVLPVLVELGDARGRATTLSRIARLLARLGRIDEAIDAYELQALPALEQDGSARWKTYAAANLAALKLRRDGSLKDRLAPVLLKAYADLRKLQWASAIADVRQSIIELGLDADAAPEADASQAPAPAPPTS